MHELIGNLVIAFGNKFAGRDHRKVFICQKRPIDLLLVELEFIICDRNQLIWFKNIFFQTQWKRRSNNEWPIDKKHSRPNTKWQWKRTSTITRYENIECAISTHNIFSVFFLRIFPISLHSIPKMRRIAISTISIRIFRLHLKTSKSKISIINT